MCARTECPPEKASDTSAARRVRLKNIDCAGLEHPAEVIRIIAIFAGGDVNAFRRAVANQAETFEIV